MLHASQSWRHDGWVVIPVITLWSQLEVLTKDARLCFHKQITRHAQGSLQHHYDRHITHIMCKQWHHHNSVLSTLQYKAPNHNCCCWINKIELNWTEPFVQRIPAPTGIISWMIVISTQTKPPSTKPKQETKKLYFLCLYVCMLKKSQNDCTPQFSSVAHVRG